jgi:hypothetical protein
MSADRVLGRSGCALLGLVLLLAIGTATASARTVCAGGPHCPRSLPQAVAAAHPGDTIKLAAGTYHGGIHIEKSIRLIGARPSKTKISGGGPVITVGRFMGTHPPRVTIEKLTIENGRTHGTGIEALGGGVYIPPAKGYKPGARVTMSEVSVVDNVAKPTRSGGPLPGQAKEWPACPGGPCRFAIAAGGGVDSWGSLTIIRSAVDHNLVGGHASDADGGGIASNLGALRIEASEIDGNRAVATWSKSRFAEGGGVFVNSGSLSISRSTISKNIAELKSKLGGFAGKTPVEMNANSGGVHVGDGVPTTISFTSISENTVEATDPAAAPSGFDSAMLMGDAPLSLNGVVFTGNHAVTSAAGTEGGPSGTALEVDGGGKLVNVDLEGNTSRVTAVHGSAAVGAALAIFNFNKDARPTTIRSSTITGNQSSATSATGIAEVFGAGILNDSLLTLEGVQVSANHALANGTSGFARGGGIWNGHDISGPPVKLTVAGSTVTENTVSGDAGIKQVGGGIFSSAPLSITSSNLSANTPEDCSGTGCP